MDQIASLVIDPVVKILARQFTIHLGYLTCSTKYGNKMRNKMNILESKSKDVTEHRTRNDINHKEIPDRVPAWLDEVKILKENVESMSGNDIGCLNIKMRYRAGRNAFKNIMRIERLINEEIIWSDASIPPGRVISASSPSGEITANDFKSRDKIFKDALMFLQQDDKASQVIALCGMPGVGKTTMMYQLIKVVKDNKVFDWIVKVDVGKDPNIHSIQHDIGLSTGEVLCEETTTARADRLFRRFKKILEDGKTKILVILDDVWENIELKDIGLACPLPNRLKLLLTSRKNDICKQIAANVDSVLKEVNVTVLEDGEAQNFFSRITGVSEDDDPDLYHIGCDIVLKCGGLPLAIKVIGTTLKSQEKQIWRNTRNLLNAKDFDDNVKKIINISYEHMKEDEDKKIFLHCALFPEDYNIPIEDLTRYAWGLNLLQNVSSLGEARDRTNACVSNLINANLLISSDQHGCVKMHDIVLACALDRVSKGDPAWVINHGDVLKGNRDKMHNNCKTISLTCMGMSEFPREFKYSSLSLLKLMHGDSSLKFPEDFFENMENLKVIDYYKMQYPLLPRSLQCSTSLVSLSLHECELMSDYSFIGDLVNLEVLSFAHCGIQKLPSTIGNLRKLRLLDLTGCVNLHIDDGVLINLVDLEELYMRVSSRKAASFTRFTDANLEELAKLSGQLFALVVEFVEENTQLKNLSFEKLDKFKISMGCVLEEEDHIDKYFFRNTLKLVTKNKSDLLACKIVELFAKTEKLHLQVRDITCLEDVISIHPYDQHTFFYLKDLEVSNCGNLKHLFPVPVANGLRKLERLKISSCPVLEALVHDCGSEMNSGDEIKFKELKFLSLKNLPKLVHLLPSDFVGVLPQLVELEVESLPNFTSIYPDKNNIYALLNTQVKIAKLEKLKIGYMENLKQIWACEMASSADEVNNISTLREIKVVGCDNLVNLFPTNSMRLLNRLKKLTITV